MANIDINNISDFDINGNSLFEDSEGFMTELSDEPIFGGAGTFGPISEVKTIVIGCVGNTCQASTVAQSNTVIVIFNH
ncbi:MAG: hypothetical protein HC939_17725 [Pleurocapsa sp. SU_5_0]|nr:hypothetical protein [Pleurocapsa sp. SU_5_0]NJR47027.1 hypothetical protein [Hyellaceae cyanobacterium CSU_1_1]